MLANDLSITNAQIKRLWTEFHQLEFPDDLMYEIIKYQFDKERMHELTRREASALIEVLIEENKKHGEQSSRLGMMTDRQRWKINDLKTKLGWNDQSLATFIKKYAHVDHTMWLTQEAASKIIEGLKRIETTRLKEKTK